MEHFYKVYRFQLIEKNIVTLVLYLIGKRFNYLIIMKLLNLVYYFVCPLYILSTLEFRGANLAWDAHSNTVTKSKSCWAEQHRPDTEGEGGSRGEGRREAGAADVTHPFVRCSWALTLSVGCQTCCIILVALPVSGELCPIFASFSVSGRTPSTRWNTDTLHFRVSNCLSKLHRDLWVILIVAALDNFSQVFFFMSFQLIF